MDTKAKENWEWSNGRSVVFKHYTDIYRANCSNGLQWSRFKCKNSPASMCARNLRSVASSDREILRGSRNFQIGHVPEATPTWGQFLVCGQEQPRIHVHSKFEKRSFIRPTDIERVPKFRNWAHTPGHAHLGANLWSVGKNSPGSTCAPNLKSVASFDTEILRGPEISKLGTCPKATPSWGPICGLRARTAQNPRAHQIWRM